MGALYHLKQKLVDFCNVIQENVSRTDTVPSSKVVYDLKADTDEQIADAISTKTADFTVSSKVTVQAKSLYKYGNVAEIYLSGTTNEALAAWDVIIPSLPDGFKPRAATNNAYQATINGALTYANLNGAGTFNVPVAIPANAGVRFCAIFITY